MMNFKTKKYVKLFEVAILKGVKQWFLSNPNRIPLDDFKEKMSRIVEMLKDNFEKNLRSKKQSGGLKASIINLINGLFCFG